MLLCYILLPRSLRLHSAPPSVYPRPCFVTWRVPRPCIDSRSPLLWALNINLSCKVCVVSPCPGLCYLCVTADNVMRVFPATDPEQPLLPANDAATAAATIARVAGAPRIFREREENAGAHVSQVQARPQPAIGPPGGLSQAQNSRRVHSQLRPPSQQPQPDPHQKQQATRAGPGSPGWAADIGLSDDRMNSECSFDGGSGSGSRSGSGVVTKRNVEGLASHGEGLGSGPSVPTGMDGFGACPAAAAGGIVLSGSMGPPTVRNPADQQRQQCQRQQGSHPQARFQSVPTSVLPDEMGNAGFGQRPAVGLLAAARPTVSTCSNITVSGGAGGDKRRRMVELDEMDLDIDLDLDLDLDLCCDGAITNPKRPMQQPCPRSPLKPHNGHHQQQLQFSHQLQQPIHLQKQHQQQKEQGQRQQIQERQQQRQQYGDVHAQPPPFVAQGTGTGTGIHSGGSHFVRCKADKPMPPPSQPGRMAHTAGTNAGGFTANAVVATNFQHQRAAPAAADVVDDDDIMVMEEVPIFSVLGKRRANEQQLQAIRQRSYPPQQPNTELHRHPPWLPPPVLQQQRPSVPNNLNARQSQPLQQPSAAAGSGAVTRPGGTSQVANPGSTESPVLRAVIESPRLPGNNGLMASAGTVTVQPSSRPVISALDLFYFQTQSQAQPQL
ncbi:hypothetical protein Vafri_4490 [Volvox africanus]|uniref:Uncharacterized protein n=1 Tax=Volvox africanus TaxID=51714 RepID=A0A8J4ETZ3_9CHLO|nr:hypothetical protein Vafri_4490 [Volvox africanus]